MWIRNENRWLTGGPYGEAQNPRVSEEKVDHSQSDSIILLSGKPFEEARKATQAALENKGMINNQVYVICRKELLMLQKLA